VTEPAGPTSGDIPPGAVPVAPSRLPLPPRFAMVHKLPFLDARRETPTATTFRFSLQGSNFRYLSNQFVLLVLPDVSDPWGPARRFSLSSSPTEVDAIAVTAKVTDSPYKQRLASLRPGEIVEVRGPIGHFLLRAERPAVMIAGGVGISPFRGMIRYAADTGLSTPIRLLYSARVPEEFAFRGELDAIARARPNISIVYTVTRPDESAARWSGGTGRVDAALVRAAARDLTDPLYYVCGTPEMVEGMASLLLDDLGVAEDRLVVERFFGY